MARPTQRVRLESGIKLNGRYSVWSTHREPYRLVKQLLR
jgi:hypothetical protein